jgi:hypothetical protein
VPVHRTLYVFANPVNRIDPYGYRPLGEFSLIEGSTGSPTVRTNSRGEVEERLPPAPSDRGSGGGGEAGGHTSAGETNAGRPPAWMIGWSTLGSALVPGAFGAAGVAYGTHPLDSWLTMATAAEPPECDEMIGAWDCEAVDWVSEHRLDFLDSAARHNTTDMPDEVFAALMASLIVDERRVGNIPTMNPFDPLGTLPRSRRGNKMEDRWAKTSIVSGSLIAQALRDGNPGLAFQYRTNRKIPEGHPIISLASVGAGNIKLHTAAKLWQGQACTTRLSEEEQCTEVDISPLQVTERTRARRFLGFELRPETSDVVDIPNPFASASSYDPEEATSEYLEMSNQLLDDQMNIEYVAAVLEAGADRARQVGYVPSAYNLTLWYKHGVQTKQEVDSSIGDRSAFVGVTVMDNMQTALDIWGVDADWASQKREGPIQHDLDGQSEYDYWLGRQE